MDGTDALAKLGGRIIHLVICDVNMPNMDGISFVKEIKSHPDYQTVPIIMLTTESREKKKLEGQVAGADAWITKPFQPDQMPRSFLSLFRFEDYLSRGKIIKFSYIFFNQEKYSEK